ncbi:Amino acid permease family protein [Clavispora lusitaniae]|uniref:Amino acid permease/ SLC12A domain-containing protein n=1 Tax=Clavispora lusitaniae (strain ATCC 42720) TaxID=306902 RepID=C4Y9B2_CLAL4|nr:uncharacterized protein CLUG_04790 [Clavispora lusitaniae ATCC 42720]EEQ40662.1 hypothetical protein CLUG_04790 [Clavispora lusitaniae ATCC 42720]KAF5209418.1 hypothetical protein E0198_003718 [Clavispora lusitaniae]KAF7581426.1 Amino acid permease family protein [Clavispora lusitaniae]
MIKDFLSDNFIPRPPTSGKQVIHVLEEPKEKSQASIISTSSSDSESINYLHRSLKGRHVQLLGIGATIGSALFVAIGKGLQYGPLNLLLGFLVWSIPILFITVSTAEFVTYLPITSPFVRMAGRCCDTALEIMTAWNFWFLCCAQIPFEVITVNSILHFWRDDFSPAIPLAVQVVLYFIINVFGVAIYGEVEFWLSLGKVVLATGLILFTFITMVGGNPKHDAFGFRYWRDPGPMYVAYHTGALGRFQGFLACLIRATFTFAGPEYVSLVASETINPRKTLPSAFKQVFIRLTIFFIGGALCVGILVPYNDPLLLETLGVTKPGAGGSPYVIAMQNLGISVLPDIVNILLVTAAFSAGNSYTYCSSRTLYGFALDGYAPKILAHTTKTGIPLYCVLISLLWALISFLQMSEGSAKVLDWIINLITSCQLINFTLLCFIYVFFYRAMKAQGIDRKTLPFVGWFQPWLAIIGGASAFTMTFVGTYTVFIPGGWDIKSFLFSYLMIFVDIAIFVGCKIWMKTKWKKPEEVDLVTGLKEVELHEEDYYRKLEALHKLKDDGTIRRSWHERLSTLLFGSEMR